MGARQKKVRPLPTAWLVTWEWVGDHAQVDEPIVAILNYRYTGRRVRDIVEQLYATSKYSIAERLLVAKNPRNNPYPPQFAVLNGGTYESSLTCGHNPYLHARIVTNLHLAEEDGVQKLRWTNLPRPSIESLA